MARRDDEELKRFAAGAMIVAVWLGVAGCVALTLMDVLGGDPHWDSGVQAILYLLAMAIATTFFGVRYRRRAKGGRNEPGFTGTKGVGGDTGSEEDR